MDKIRCLIVKVKVKRILLESVENAMRDTPHTSCNGIAPCFIDTTGYCLTCLVNVDKFQLVKKHKTTEIKNSRKKVSYSKVKLEKDGKKMNVIRKFVINRISLSYVIFFPRDLDDKCFKN